MKVGFGFALASIGLIFAVFLIFQAFTNPTFSSTEQLLLILLACVVSGASMAKAMSD